ncbi:MAG: hypothetical protein QOJ35_3373 [Solirubrobacteraceae bacterium]|nr:hypothetical protein [Solirubrobacteraceae bacterium]
MRRIGLAGVLAMLLTLSGFTVATTGAFANGTVGSFEIDGNIVDSPAGEPIDWSTPPPNLTSFTDATGNGDDSFNQGSKETAPGAWSCITGSAPQKDDITAGQVAFRTIGGKQFVYVDYTRRGVNGDAHIDYEFNQSSVANPSCPALPKRTSGDIVLTFDTSNGGATISVNAYKWVGDAFTGSFTTLATGSEHTTWDGAVNIPNSIPGHTAGDFGEAALDLTDTIGAISCGQFATSYMKTRSSTSIDAALQDRTSTKPLKIGDCPTSSLTKAVRNVTKNGSFGPTASALSGETLEYQLTYQNVGAAPATNVTIADNIQAGQTYLSCSPACMTLGVPPTSVSWHFDSVAVNQTIVLTFQVQLDASFPNGTTLIKNVGTFTNHEEGTKSSNETTVTVTSVPKSNLTKGVRNVTTGGTSFATSVDASPGDVVEYQLSYSNTGTGAATNVVISDPIPTKTTFTSCSDACMQSGTPTSSVSWTFASVPAGESRVVTFRVTLDSTGWAAGTATPVTNTAKACTTEEGTACTTTPPVTVTVKTPSSSLAKAVRTLPSTTFVTSTTAAPGDSVEYRLTYKNSGPGIAHAVVISDPIPSHTTFVSCSNTCTPTGTPVTSVSWSLGDVASGGTTVVTFVVKLDASFPSGTTTISNVGTLDTREEPPTDSNPVTVTVTSMPKSNVAKAVRNETTGTTFGSATDASPGDTIEYRLTYTNTGTSTATNVVLSDPIPAKTTFLTCSDSCTQSGSPVSSVSWMFSSVAPGAMQVVTFRVKLDTTGWTAGTSTPVTNTAKACTTEEGTACTTSPPVTVTVNPPSSSIAKAVRTLPSTTFVTSTTAAPGDSVEYRLTYKNSGPGIAHDVTISDPVPAHTTFVSCSDTCMQTGTPVSSVSWSLGDVASGVTKVVTFVVKLDAAFPAGTTTITNVARFCSREEGCTNSPPVTVTVTAATQLKLVKTASTTSSVAAGDNITYTLAYSNTGNANATNATITETIPAGSTFVSCSNSCTTDGPPVTKATWSVGTIKPGDTGSVTLTVQVSGGVGCQICNIATIASPDQTGTVSSNQLCLNAQPSSDPSTAKANGDAVGLRAYVPLLGIPLVNVNISHAASSQTGPGNAADHDEFLHLDILGVVGLASVAKADVLRTTSASQVTKALGARQTTTSEVLGLNVLSGVVTADVLRSVASASADGTASSFSAAGTTATNLKVLGSSVANLTPGARIPLDGNTINRLLYGKGSYVAVNEQTGTTSGPASGQLSGGTYKSDLTVTMVRVYITGGTIGGLLTLGGAPVEITIAKAMAHAEHKQTALCTSSPTKAVSGHAFVASAQVDPLLDTSTVGFVDIPASGGHANKSVTASVLPADGSVVSTTDAAADTTGTNGATSSTASSYAQTAGACVLKIADPNCLIKATLIRSQANSSATSAARSSNATGTQFVDLVVAGISIVGTPAPNTTIRLPLGLGYVVLNEQVPDGPETGHTGLTVRAIHVKISLPLAPLLVGAEVIVAEAHSDATFR